MTATLLSDLAERGPFAVRMADAPLPEGKKPEEGKAYADYVSFTGEDVQVTVRLDNMWAFPDYEQVIPNGEERVALVVKKAELQEAIQACAAFTTKKSRGIRFDCSGSVLKLSVITPDVGKVERLMSCQGPDALTFGLNCRYIADAVAQASNDCDYVCLSVKDEKAPISIQEEGFQAVIMPMRVF